MLQEVNVNMQTINTHSNPVWCLFLRTSSSLMSSKRNIQTSNQKSERKAAELPENHHVCGRPHQTHRHWVLAVQHFSSLNFFMLNLSQTSRFLSPCSHVRPRRSSDVKNLRPRSSSRHSSSATSTNHLRGGRVSGSSWPVRAEYWWKDKLSSLIGRSLKKTRKRTFCTAAFCECFQLSVIILML